MDHAAHETERKSISNNIHDARAPVSYFKAMGVMPELVRSLYLQILKLMGRLPLGDFSPPAKWNAMPAKPVIDLDTRSHFEGLRSENLKAQPLGRQNLQISSIGKEQKDFLQWTWDPLLALECKRYAHAVLYIRCLRRGEDDPARLFCQATFGHFWNSR